MNQKVAVYIYAELKSQRQNKAEAVAVQSRRVRTS